MDVEISQQTVAGPVTCSGVGVHSGKRVNLILKPAPANHGIKFVRTDLPDHPRISAHFNSVVDTSLATVIGYNGCIVSTIEHLMAALAGLSIDNALVELDAYEVPIMDGSAGPFTDLIQSAGIRALDAPRYFFVIETPIELAENGKFVGVYPFPGVKITCAIEFDHPQIQKQSYSLDLTGSRFEQEISRARTFGFMHEIDYLKRFGFAKGGSLENVIAIDKNGVMNREGLRYPDEFVRHKILDSIGDLSLLGMPILGHLKMEKSGHAFNHAFLRKFFAEKNAWSTRTFQQPPADVPAASKALAI